MQSKTRYTAIARADFGEIVVEAIRDHESEREHGYFVEYRDENEEFATQSLRGNLEETMFRFMEVVQAEENKREFERNL